MPEVKQEPTENKGDPQPESDWSWYDLAHEGRAKRRVFFIALPIVMLTTALLAPLLADWLDVEPLELIGLPVMGFAFYLAAPLAAARWPLDRHALARTFLSALGAAAYMAVWSALLWRIGVFR